MVKTLIASFTVVVALITVVHCSSQAPDHRPIWGGAMEWSAKVDFQAEHHRNWTFQYYYLSNDQGSYSRYEHDGDQYDEMCEDNHKAPNMGQNTPCNVVFATNGWSYLQYPANGYCCRCRQDFGAVRYNWLDRCQATYMGQTPIRYKGRDERGVVWQCHAQFDNNYSSIIGSEIPGRFWEHKNGELKAWYFNLDTYKREKQDPSLFEPLADCTELCPSGPCAAGR